MIIGTLRPTHGSSNLYFIKVTAPDNEVPVFGPGMHPRSIAHVTELEEGVCDGKTQFRAETVTIHVAHTMMTNDTLTYVVIFADPGIEIAQQYDFVILQNPSEWNAMCHKSDLSHHQMSLMLENRHSQR